MRIYIHTDMEGASGICEGVVDGKSVVRNSSDRYEESRALLIGDVNAAVAGAFDGGATHVAVLDSHGGRGNFAAADIDSRAEFDPVENKLWWGKLDESYNATFFIGAHAMAGTMGAFLDHTQSTDEFFDFCVNGRRFGELGQWAMVAAEFGVPLVMVSGDEAACTEARAFFDPVETASVKRGTRRMHADCLPLDEARARIRVAAKNAISLIGMAKPLALKKPIEYELTCTNTGICDKLVHPGIERLDARTIRWVRKDGFGIFPWYE